MKNKLLTFFIAGIFLPLFSGAQEIEMADNFRSNGKIYVVIAVMILILVGIFLYLLSIGNRISRLEKKLAERK